MRILVDDTKKFKAKLFRLELAALAMISIIEVIRASILG